MRLLVRTIFFSLIFSSALYSQGPLITPLIPRAGEWAGCALQRIYILITDPDGVNPSSITLSVNGTIYFYPDHMSYNSDTLIFTPTSSFHNGDTVRVVVLEARDNFGNSIPAPVSYEFYIDLDYPFITYNFPLTGSTVRWLRPDISVVIRDTTSGIAFGSVCFCLNVGTFVCDSTGASGWCDGSGVVDWSGDTVTFHTSRLPYYFTDEGDVVACINHGVDYVGSDPRICGSHSITSGGLYCWSFRIDSLAPRASLLFPGFGDWVACDSIVLRTFDLSGIDTTKIQIRIGDNTFYVHQVLYSWVVGNDIYYLPPTPFRTGDSVAIRILRLEDRVGNRAYSGSFPPWYFKVDKSPPYVQSVSPAPNSFVGSPSPTISIALSDSGSGVRPESLIVTINGTPFNTMAPPVRWNNGVLTINTAGLGYNFSDGETVRVCVTRALDKVLPENCGPNRMSPYCFSFYIDLAGPVATLLTPSTGVFVACPYESIFIRLYDRAGIDLSSLSLSINGVTYDTSNGIRFRSDTLIFVPQAPWTSGDTIRISLVSARDRLGNNISAPLNSYFIVDRTPPEFVLFRPEGGSIFGDSTPVFSVRVRDRLSGFNPNSSYIVIQGDPFFPPVGFSFVGDTFSFNTRGRGIRFSDRESVRVCWDLRDNVSNEYCGPNTDDSCVTYLADFSPPQYTLLLPPSGTVTACPDQRIRILIRDVSGVDVSSVRMNVNGITYSVGANLAMRGDTLVFTPSGNFNNGDTVRFGLTAFRDNVGNGGSSGIIWYFVVDRESPRITATFPNNMDIIGDVSPTIIIYVSDNLAGVRGDSLKIRVRGNYYGIGSPGFSWDGTRIRFNTRDAGLTFANNETVQVCLTKALDNIPLVFCGPNRLMADSCFSFIVSLEGPTVSILFPPEGAFSACLYQQIGMLFSRAVVPESTEVMVNSVRYRYPEPHLQFRGDTLIFTPTTPWSEGSEVLVHVNFAMDLNGIPISTSPYWSFMPDYSSPRVTEIYPAPGSFLNSPAPQLRLILRDSLSGINWGNFRLRLNGRELSLTTPGVSRSDDTVFINTLYAGFNFRTGDTIRLCITNLEDNVSVSLCGPNRISRDTCVTYVVDLDGPVAQLISPPHGSSTACARENIRIRISDFSSILIDSVRVRIRGVLYTRASPRIRFSGDTLIFTPSSDWVNGDSVEIELVSAYDIAGNPLSGAPLRWYFRVDRRPPILWGASPPNLTIISNPSQLVSFFIYDSISGVDSSSVMVRARGRNYGLGSPGFALSGNQIRFNPSLAGLTISNGDTVLYCAFGADRVSGTLCGPNRSDTLCTRIIYDLSPPISNLLIPDNGSYSSCVDQNIILQLYDLYGINTNSIRLTVNGITYSIDSSQVSYVDTLLIFTPTRFFHHNDTVNISLMVSDIAGNTYASPRTWRFFIDTIPPVISSTQPAPGSFVGREDTISFMVNDGTSGVDWTSLRVEIGGFVFRLGDRGVVRDGNRVYLVLDSLGLSFAGVETVPVCISVSDNSRYCGANRLTQCFNYAFDLAGPIPILLLPAHNSISACSTQSIRIAFSDPNGLRRTSVILRINGVNYNSSSSQIRFTDSTLIFTPTTRWSEGIVTVRVLSVSDTLGNTTSMDFDWLFGIDYSPPFVLGYRPINGTISGDSTGGIWIRLSDTGSGVDPSSIRLTVNGVTYPYGSPAITFSGGLLRFNPGAAGVSFTDEETVRVVVVASDRPSYCGPNAMAPFSFWFVMDLRGPVVSLIAPQPGYTSSCARLGVRFAISDRSGIDTTSIVLSINGRMVGIGSPEVNYVSGMIVYEPQSDFRNGDTVRVSVVRVNDIWSHTAQFMGSNSTFYIIDRTPPVVVGTFPPDGASTSDTNQILWFAVLDSISPVDPSFFIIEVNGTSFSYGDSGLTWDGFRLTLNPFDAGIYFSNGETVRVCLVGAADSPDTCGPNYLTRQYCFSFSVDRSGPVARIVSPALGSFYSCEGDSQRIVVELFDPDGIIPDSIIFFVNGTRILYGGSLNYSNPYLIYQPPEPWRSGDTIFVELQNACDTYGNRLQLPLSWYFVVDTISPEVIWNSPRDGSIISDPRPAIRIVIVDPLSGLNRNSVIVTVNDSVYRFSGGILWRGDTLVIPSESLRVSFSDGERVRVCVTSAQDRATGCGPNRLSSPYCFSFTIELGAPIARPLVPLPGSFVSCGPGDQRVFIYLYDRNGIDWSSLDFRVNGVRYAYGSYLLSYRDTMLIFEPVGSPWRDGDTVRIELRSVRDSLGNALTTPLVYNFFVDNSPPAVEFDTIPPFIGGRERSVNIRIYDELSGLDSSSVRISVNGIDAPIGARGIIYVDSICSLPIDSFVRLSDGDTVFVCVSGARDKAYVCPPNSLETPMCKKYTVDLMPPQATLIRPPTGIYSSCGLDSIIFRFIDRSSVDPSTIRFILGGIIYNISSPELIYRDSILIFYPRVPFADGTRIEFELFGYGDIVGNISMDTIRAWYIVDISPPEFELISPLAVVSDSTPLIRVRVYDMGSGVDTTSILFELNGRDFDIFSPALNFVGDTLVFDPRSVSIAFGDGESVSVCIRGVLDNAGVCGQNRIREPYCFSFIVSLAGPLVRLVEPSQNSYISCRADSQRIRISIIDPDGVNVGSIVVEVNGVIYRYGSPNMSYIAGMLELVPAAPFSNGDTVDVRLISAEDSLGNAISHQYSWRFFVDTDPPYITFIEPIPGSVEYSRTPTIRIVMVDSFAGLRYGSLSFSVNGEVFLAGETGLSWVNDTLIFNTFDAGLEFFGGESVSVCLQIEDSTTLCAPNRSDTCFYFTISSLGPVARVITPLNGEYVSCDSQWVIFRLYSSSGSIDTSTIRVVYGSDTLIYGEPYIYYNPTDSTLTVWPRRHYGGGEYVNVGIISATDELGNTLQRPATISFTIDLTSPRLIYSSIRDSGRMSPPDTIRFVIDDDISGLLDSSIRIRFDTTELRYGDRGIMLSGDTVIIVSELAGLSFIEEEPFRICLRVSDRALYCGANSLDTCQTFIPTSRAPEFELVYPPSGVFYSCDSESVLVRIYDIDGVLETTIVAFVGDTIWTFEEDRFSFDGENLRFPLCIASPGETVSVRVSASDSLGNSGNSGFFYYIFDPYPPILLNFTDTIRRIPDTLEFTFIDSISGVDSSSVLISFNDSEYSELGVVGGRYLTGTVYVPVGDTVVDYDSIRVCFRIDDRVGFCEPNLLDTCVTVFVRVEGPVVVMIEPHPYSYTSCDSGAIRLLFMNRYGVFAESTVARINEFTYRWGSELMRFNGDTLILYPYESFANGDTVTVELLQAYDTLGNRLIRPVSFRFYVDLAPPYIVALTPSPGELTPYTRPTIVVELADSLSGVNFETARLIVGGVDYSSRIVIEGDSIILYGDSLDRTFRLNDTIPVELIVCDNSLYCGANCLRLQYNFVCGNEGPELVPIEPLPETFTSCSTQTIRILSIDNDGILWDSLTLIIKDTQYSIESPNVRVLFDTVLFSPTEPFDDGETVHVHLELMDIYRNRPAIPLDYFFIVDLQPPDFTTPSPFGTVVRSDTSIGIDVFDRGSGIMDESLMFIIGNDTLGFGEVGFHFDGGRMRFLPLEFNDGRICGRDGGIWFFERETVYVAACASDRAMYCSGNSGCFGWSFFVSDDDTIPPQLISFEPNPVLDSSRFFINVIIFDSSGIDSAFILWDTDSSLTNGGERISELVRLDSMQFRSAYELFASSGFVFRVYAWDADTDCGVPLDRAMGVSEDIRLHIIPRLGPEAQLIEPLSGWYSSCADQGVLIRLSDIDGIDTRTILFVVNGESLSVDGVSLLYNRDTLVYHPARAWENGDTVRFYLISANDIWGNPLRTPISGYFIVDLMPPYCVLLSHTDSSYILSGAEIKISMNDSISGINPSTISVRANGRVCPFGSAGVSFSQGVLTVNTGLIDYGGRDSLFIEIRADDSPDICEPNRGECSFFFMFEPEIQCDASPNPFTPNGDPFNPVVRFLYPHIETEEAELLIYDYSGRVILRKNLPPGGMDSWWDGRMENGKDAPFGKYIYVITRGKKVICKGTVILAR